MKLRWAILFCFWADAAVTAQQSKSAKFTRATIAADLWVANQTFSNIPKMMACAALAMKYNFCHYVYDGGKMTCEIGTSNINFKNGTKPGIDIYYTVDPNAVWSNYGPWSNCAGPCIPAGKKNKTRTCSGNCPTPDSALGCVGNDTELVDCLEACQSEYESNSTWKLFLIGSSQASDTYKAEIMDLNNSNNNCPTVPQYPGASSDSVSVYLGSMALVCGGYNPTTSLCYTYSPSVNNWSLAGFNLTVARGAARAVLLSPNEWWVTGGGNNGGVLSSTELYNTVTGTFAPYTDLPTALRLHNLVRINETNVILLGGETASNLVWMFDRGTNNWTSLPTMLQPRGRTQAGLVVSSSAASAALVVCGGYNYYTDNCESFNFTTKSWSYTTYLPISSRYDTGFAHTYGGNFLLMGNGYTTAGNTKQIYIYNMDGGNWTMYSKNTTFTHVSGTAFLVPNDFVICN